MLIHRLKKMTHLEKKTKQNIWSFWTHTRAPIFTLIPVIFNFYSLFCVINCHAKGIQWVNIMLNTVRDFFLGSSESKCEEATGFMRHSDQPTGCSASIQPSTSFNSWLWLKFHDSVLVVAKGTLIDKSEIYSAVASCRLEKREKGIRGGYYRGLYYRLVTQVWHNACSRWPLVNSFHLFSP